MRLFDPTYIIRLEAQYFPHFLNAVILSIFACMNGEKC